MNVALLRQVKAAILAEPDAFRMDTWTCGTAHCIAGWTLLLCGNPIMNPEAQAPYHITASGEIPKRAASRALEISCEASEEWKNETEADRLFFVEWWPHDMHNDFEEADDRSERAKIAAARIDHFIATNGAE